MHLTFKSSIEKNAKLILLNNIRLENKTLLNKNTYVPFSMTEADFSFFLHFGNYNYFLIKIHTYVFLYFLQIWKI